MFSRSQTTGVRCGVAATLAIGFVGAGLVLAGGEWTQWGGPHRDFTVDAGKLADKWPEAGPLKVWSQPIEYAHSSILVDGDRLYTMCRRGEQDVVLCLDANSGKTVWETAYDAPTRPGMDLEFGPGPHSTPLIEGDRLFTVGGMTHFHCLDKGSGKILWSHDLMEELGASHLQRGYGASPIAYKGLVIVNIGSAQAGLAAFKQSDGELVWKSEACTRGYASPLIARFNGEDMLIAAIGPARIVLDPTTGETRCRTNVDTQSFGIMSSPIWVPPDKVFCTAGYGGGSRLFELKFENDGYTLTELWHYRKMQVAHGTAVHVDGAVYGSSHGSFGPAFLMAIDLKTGKPLWRKRGLAKANVLYADGKLIILDETGTLALAKADRDGVEICSTVKVLEELSWTAPTLVGTRLYLRDHHHILCLDLGAAANQ